MSSAGLTHIHPSRNEDVAKDLSMQKYLILAAQQDSLRRSIVSNSPSESPTTISRSDSEQSQSTSPPPRHSPVSTQTQQEHSPHDDAAAAETELTSDMQKLLATNQHIKQTLTQLLKYVNNDLETRRWVTSRLMDVESQLKMHRRRRSSADTDASGETLPDLLSFDQGGYVDLVDVGI